MGKRVAVIGGGNTAVDVARTVWRLGAEEVNIVYRRTIKEMPAAAHEIEETQKEGIKITYLTAPLEIIQKNGKVSGIKCIKMKLGEPDSSGRRRPVPVEGSEHEIKADMVVAAVSQAPDLSFMDPSLQLKVSKWETLETNPLTMVTNQEGDFCRRRSGHRTCHSDRGYRLRQKSSHLNRQISKQPTPGLKANHRSWVG